MNNLNYPGASWLDAKALVLGCGNVLFGDDGFGPALVSRLRVRPDIPANVLIEDVGTGVRELLFDIILSDKRPGMIIAVDAASKIGRRPGEVFELPVASEVDPIVKTTKWEK